MPVDAPTVNPFDPGIPVAVLPLNTKSHAFAIRDPEQPVILLDERVLSYDWFFNAHLMVILAHEMGHILGETDDEQAADDIGLELLSELAATDPTKQGALEFYQLEYEARYSDV